MFILSIVAAIYNVGILLLHVCIIFCSPLNGVMVIYFTVPNINDVYMKTLLFFLFGGR